MNEALSAFPGYETLLIELKQRLRTEQARAALAVNSELVLLYWRIGNDISSRMREHD